MSGKDFLDGVDSTGIPLLEMAVDRSQFETKIQEKFVGALRETAFILLAKKNGQTKWVEHKEFEIERLRLELNDVFDYQAKGTWDKRKAAIEAIEYYRGRLKSFVTTALNQYARYYKSEPKQKIDSQDLLGTLEEILKDLPTDRN